MSVSDDRTCFSLLGVSIAWLCAMYAKTGMLLENWLPHNLVSISPLQELGVDPRVLVCETIALETRIS